ncbi:YbbC/YhhH family protein [Pedobacter ureilyticus]|uniref:YbbC/YhhH family protein n=1 Tax=Pedobacter ureilyticus TaxID=1393051 RepID=A0ABW9J860_9SPHI|nr:YbbC/YhhH family protein [Pedobacter helvus]
MTNIKSIYFLILLIFTLIACGQTKSDRTKLDKSYAEQELKSALTDKSQHNVIDNNSIIIKDSLTAINIAEPILFSIYGKDNITKQRPYEIYFIDNYWVISGTLPKDCLGGTFLIIIDARDGKINKITHGK